MTELQQIAELSPLGLAAIAIAFAFYVLKFRKSDSDTKVVEMTVPSKEDSEINILTTEIQRLSSYYNHDLTARMDKFENKLDSVSQEMSKIKERLVAVETSLKVNH